MYDVIALIVGEYTLLVIIQVILSVFLNRFCPPIKEQWKFSIMAIVGMTLSYLIAPSDLKSLAYGFIVAGLVMYKNVLIDELKLVITAAKHVNQNKDDV